MSTLLDLINVILNYKNVLDSMWLKSAFNAIEKILKLKLINY